MKLSSSIVVAALASSAAAFAPVNPQRSAAASSATVLQFGFLKDLGLEKPSFLPDFGSAKEEEVDYSNGLNVGDAFPKDAVSAEYLFVHRRAIYIYH